jgi:hypothetical protein
VGEDLTHPGWCDPVHCTATVQKPEYRAGETGFHRSAPVALAHLPSVGLLVFDSEINPLMAHLSQAAPPWDTGALLNVGTADDPGAVTMPASQAHTVLDQLGQLAALADG